MACRRSLKAFSVCHGRKTSTHMSIMTSHAVAKTVVHKPCSVKACHPCTVPSRNRVLRPARCACSWLLKLFQRSAAHLNSAGSLVDCSVLFDCRPKHDAAHPICDGPQAAQEWRRHLSPQCLHADCLKHYPIYNQIYKSINQSSKLSCGGLRLQHCWAAHGRCSCSMG